MTKGSPAGVQHAPGTGLTYCRQCEPDSCSGRTGTVRPLAVPPEHLPQNAARDTVECLLQVHKTQPTSPSDAWRYFAPSSTQLHIPLRASRKRNVLPADAVVRLRFCLFRHILFVPLPWVRRLCAEILLWRNVDEVKWYMIPKCYRVCYSENWTDVLCCSCVSCTARSALFSLMRPPSASVENTLAASWTLLRCAVVQLVETWALARVAAGDRIAAVTWLGCPRWNLGVSLSLPLSDQPVYCVLSTAWIKTKQKHLHVLSWVLFLWDSYYCPQQPQQVHTGSVTAGLSLKELPTESLARSFMNSTEWTQIAKFCENNSISGHN